MKSQRNRIPRVRILRRRAGLSQRDLGTLLGFRGHSQVSRYENGRRTPTADELLQLQVIFGVVPSGQFPHLHDRAAQVVVARIDRILKRERGRPVTGQPSRKAVHFQRVLDSIRRQLAPGLTAQEPWPIATAPEDLESNEV